MKYLQFFIIFTVGIALLSACSSMPERKDFPEDDHGLTDYLTEFVGSFREQKKLEGLSVAVVLRGETVLARGFGWADREAGKKLTASTPMPVGSVSKIFTALAVMQLSERGLLDIDAVLADYFPEMKLADGGEKKIHIRNLLTHHGGLPGDRLGGWIPEHSGLESLRSLPGQMDDTYLISEPGSHFSYSNIGFGLLGLIVERTSGKKYDDYIRDELFAPAAMKDAIVYPKVGDQRLPLGYGIGEAAPPVCIRDIPAGSLLLSAADGAAFIRTLYSDEKNRFLERESLNEMLSRQNTGVVADGEFEIGLTFWLIDPLGVRTPLASHGGDLPPFNSILITMPEHRSGILVSSNDFGKDGSGAMQLGVELAGILLDHLGEKQTGSSLPPVREWKDSEPEVWNGFYPSLIGPIEIKNKGDDMILKMLGKKFHAVPREGDALSIEFRVLGFRIPIKTLESLKFTLYDHDGATWLGLWMGGVFGGSVKRVPYPEYDAGFEHFAGTYKLAQNEEHEVVREVSIRKDGNIYFIEFELWNMKMKLPLKQSGRYVAITTGQGRGLGEPLVFKETGNKTILHWSGLELQKENHGD